MSADIIVADDYDDNRELMKLILDSAGFAVREARNGIECIALAREKPPAAILVDLSMPLMDGWETLKELRKHELTRSIPCVAVTAVADTDLDELYLHGFDGYISKPFRSKDLIDVVERLINETPS